MMTKRCCGQWVRTPPSWSLFSPRLQMVPDVRRLSFARRRYPAECSWRNANSPAASCWPGATSCSPPAMPKMRYPPKRPCVRNGASGSGKTKFRYRGEDADGHLDDPPDWMRATYCGISPNLGGYRRGTRSRPRRLARRKAPRKARPHVVVLEMRMFETDATQSAKIRAISRSSVIAPIALFPHRQVFFLDRRTSQRPAPIRKQGAKGIGWRSAIMGILAKTATANDLAYGRRRI